MEITIFGFWLMFIFSVIGIYNTFSFFDKYYEKRLQERKKLEKILSEYDSKKKSNWDDF